MAWIPWEGQKPVPSGKLDHGAINLVSKRGLSGKRVTFLPRSGLKLRPSQGIHAMRFYTKQHPFYCGIDLHARTMHTCILDQQGSVVLDKNLPCKPKALLDAIAPFQHDIVVGCECMFGWYWLADLCMDHQPSAIAFVLGHALYMKAIHGGKAKNDRIDAQKIAVLLRGGMLPQASVYPAAMRATRD